MQLTFKRLVCWKILFAPILPLALVWVNGSRFVSPDDVLLKTIILRSASVCGTKMYYLIQSQSSFSSSVVVFFLLYFQPEIKSEENQQAQKKRGLHEEEKGTLKDGFMLSRWNKMKWWNVLMWSQREGRKEERKGAVFFPLPSSSQSNKQTLKSLRSVGLGSSVI